MFANSLTIYFSGVVRSLSRPRPVMLPGFCTATVERKTPLSSVAVGAADLYVGSVLSFTHVG